MAKTQLIIDLKTELNKADMDKAVNAVRAALGSAADGIDFGESARGLTESNNAVKQLATNTTQAQSAAKGLSAAFAFNQTVQAVQAVSSALNEVISVSNEFESTLAAVGAITGFSGDALANIGDKARDLAREFGGSASDQLKSFQGILSKLGPQVAENSDALALFGKNVSTLSAASGDDAATSMSAITDSMLQFGLTTGDAMKDAETSTRIINALAASAQVGAAEIPQVAESILQAGVAAKGANLSFEQTNAAIQVLAVGGKTGSEAGVALRNVLGLIQNASGPAEAAMSKLGTSSKELGEILTTEGFDVALRQIKTGMDGLGSAAERNATLMQIFGTENAAAAGILLDNLDQYGSFLSGIEAGEQGIGSAFEQAAVRMNTSEGMIARMKAGLSDLFITVGSTLGSTASAMFGFANSVAPTVTTLAGLGNILPFDQIKQFSLSLISKLVPSLVMSDVATKALVLNKSALSAANIRETATTAISTTAKLAATAATSALTFATVALNAAFVTSPVGWIVLGLGAIVGAVYLLYKNFESVRNIINVTFSALGSAADFVGNIFSGVASAVGSLFSDSGKSAGQSFADGFKTAQVKDEIAETSEAIKEAFSEGVKIKATIDKAASLPEIIKNYESINSEIAKLQAKSQSEGLTDGEKAKFTELQKSAQTAAEQIQAIAPASKGMARTVVDEVGNLKQVYDVNISKAKEFVNANEAQSQLAGKAREYSSELIKQANNIDNLVKLNDANKAAIDRASDPKAKQKLIDEYNKERAAIEENRKALVASFVDGSQYGLVTSDAIARVAKSMNVSNEEARKMLVAKSLDEASKKGKVTEEAVGKIAEKFGYSREKALELWRQQQKNTAEAQATADAAKNIGDAYDEVKKKLQDSYDFNKKQVLAYEQMIAQGKKLSAEQQKDYEIKKKYLESDTKQLKQRNTLESKINEQYNTAADTKKKEAKDSRTAYDIAKEKYENDKDAAELAKRESELRYKESILNSGRLETEIEKRNRSLEVLKADNVEQNRRKLELAGMLRIAQAMPDNDKKIKAVAEAQKMLADLDIELANNLVSQRTILVTGELNDKKIAEDIAKINADAEKATIEFEVRLGLREQSDLIENEINSLQSELASTNNELEVQIGLRSKGVADEKAIAEYQAKTQDLNRQIATKSIELDRQLALERVNAIKDADKQLYELRIESAAKLYQEELALAVGNEAKKQDALIKYQTEKLSAEQDYLKKKSLIYSTLDNISESFKGIDLSPIKKDVSENIKDIESQKKALEDSLKKGEISTSEYVARDKELTAELAKAKSEANGGMVLNYKAALSAIGSALQAQADKEASTLASMLAKRNAFELQSADLTKQIQALKTQNIANEEQNRFDLIQSNNEKIKKLEEEQKAVNEQSAAISQNVWTQSLSVVGTQFASFAATTGNMGKALAKSIFSAARAMVPTFALMIYGLLTSSPNPVNVLSLGTAGAAAATAITIGLYGLLAAAESAIGGFKKGGYTGDGNPNTAAGVVHKGEYVMPATATQKNLTAFREIDKGGLTVERWYETKYSSKLKERMEKHTQAAVERAEIVYQVELQRRENDNRSLKNELKQTNKRLAEMSEKLDKMAVNRKSESTANLKINVDKSKLVKAVVYEDYKSIRRM